MERNLHRRLMGCAALLSALLLCVCHIVPNREHDPVLPNEAVLEDMIALTAAVASKDAAALDEIAVAEEAAVMAFSDSGEFNLFAEPLASPDAPEETTYASPSGTPTPSASPVGFSLEVLSASARENRPFRVFIYHTHTYEAYEPSADTPYQETERWRTADAAYNVIRVGEELAGLLRGLGAEVTHDSVAYEPPNLSGAYARSLKMLERRTNAGEQYDLYIDLHRDAYAGNTVGANTVNVGGTEAARLMLLIGKGEGQTGEGFDIRPNWEANLTIARWLTDALNAQSHGLCKDVCIKSGRFNQHIAVGCVLIEVGNNRNTLSEALAAMPYLADALAAWGRTLNDSRP